jgi:hypothetical protein
MRKIGIISLVILISSMGLAYSACDLGYNTTDINNWTCLKIIYLGQDGRNLTLNIFDPATTN